MLLIGDKVWIGAHTRIRGNVIYRGGVDDCFRICHILKSCKQFASNGESGKGR